MNHNSQFSLPPPKKKITGALIDIDANNFSLVNRAVIDPCTNYVPTDQTTKIYRFHFDLVSKQKILINNDKNTLLSLKQLYARTGQTEKYNKVKEKLEN